MWADNETEIDLLGFEFLVDSLIVALTEPRLLPVTVGLLGDWGSGKSSLMKIVAAELNGGHDEPAASTDAETLDDPNYLTVAFSPWQYEDVDDVKTALMNSVLDALAERIPGSEQRVGRLKSFTATLRRLGRRAGAAVTAAGPTLVPFLVQAAAPDTDPEMLKLTGDVTAALATQVAPAFEEPAPDTTTSDSQAPKPISDVGEFRREFADLITTASPRIDAVIVFVDDLDRCLPETIVDTFETIRLFLNTPKTAYVLALNQTVVESAIDARYPDLQRSDGAGIGRDYLEKMLQLKIVIPALSAPEAETYANLLFAELHLEPDRFDTVVRAAAKNRAVNGLSVAFNAGVCGETLDGDIPADLARDLGWSANIMPVLGSSLRGNPRQLKRFLNNLLLKYRSAQRREVGLKLPELAKLMVLEDQYNSDFQKLFDWQLGSDGPSPQLVVAEQYARAIGTAPDTDEKPPHDTEDPAPPTEPAAEDIRAWADKPHIAAWLSMDPPLSGVDLRPYFTYSRDKLSFGVSASRLAPHLQQLLGTIQADIEATRRAAYPEIAALDAAERAQLIEALLDRIARHPAGTALTAAIEIAELNPDVVDTIAESLRRVPPASIPRTAGTTAVRRLPADNPKVVELLDYWQDSDNKALAGMVKPARAAQRRKAR